MGWASYYIERLLDGETVSFRPRGNSMTPRIRSGQLCTVTPLDKAPPLRPGDVVLCRVRGTEYLHYAAALHEDRVRIENARGHVNGWVGINNVFGKLIKVEP